MTEKTYIEKVEQIKSLLKSQKVFDYMLELMNVRLKNRLPKEEGVRNKYDAERLKTHGEKAMKQILAHEKNELVGILKSNHLVRHYALLLVGTHYGSNAFIKDLEKNLKRIETAKPYASHIMQNKIKIPADRIRQMTYC